MNAIASAGSSAGAIVTHAEMAHYARHGYAVVRNLVPRSNIQALLALYAGQIVPSQHRFFRQNTNTYEPNKLTQHGYVQQSFLDIHDYAKYAQFSRTAREIFCAPSMMEALRRVTGFVTFSLMQTMLFDRNTETPGHQDWYYLDTVPVGNLIAAWIALEDIDERAGRFYVLRGSQQHDFGARLAGRTHADWLAVIGAYIDAHPEDVSAPALRAGDVLFWNSRTVHGSSRTLDEAFSRKSLTAHYLPGGFEFGNLFSVKQNIPYKSHSGVPFYRNQPDFTHWNRLKFAVKTHTYNYPKLRETLRSLRTAVARGRGTER